MFGGFEVFVKAEAAVSSVNEQDHYKYRSLGANHLWLQQIGGQDEPGEDQANGYDESGKNGIDVSEHRLICKKSPIAGASGILICIKIRFFTGA